MTTKVKKLIRLEEYKDTDWGMLVIGRVGIPIGLTVTVWLVVGVILFFVLALLGTVGLIGWGWLFIPAVMLGLVVGAAVTLLLVAAVLFLIEEFKDASKEANK